jgi:alpha-ribazole phosphatase
VILLRHGATDWNNMKLAQGHADIPLNDEGWSHAFHAARDLYGLNIDAVYASDLQRARDTAHPIASTHGLEVELDPELREIDQGDWEGLHVEEIKKTWPEIWGPARHYSARPGGESPQHVRERALGAVRRIVDAHPDGTVVIVSHGGTIRWLCAEVLGYDDHRSARLRGLGNGGATAFDAAIVDGRLEFANFHRLDGNTPDLDDPND